jgi:hypothetical protein
VAGLDLDLLGHFSASKDSEALEFAEDGLEAALFHLEPAFQALDHIPVGVGIFHVYVERGRIREAGPAKPSQTERLRG